MSVDRVAALVGERAALLRFCAGLSDAQWRSDSAARGWRVQDVVAHLGASCHAMFTPAALTIRRTSDIESANEVLVARRRDWPPQRVLAEYERWSARTIRLARIASRTPLGQIRSPLGELGTFRLDRTLTSALVFDHHTHLRHDIMPSLQLPAPPTDANRMTVVVEWMLAVFSNQLHSAPPSWLPGPIELTLTGPGGGSWLIRPDGAITAGVNGDPTATVRSPVIEFPRWGTQRADWRHSEVLLSGNTEHATRFLDATNIV